MHSPLTPKPFITLDQVTVRIGGAWLLDRVNWRINCGENWVLWGDNGAGKSTLAKALMGQLAVVRGRILRHYADNASRETVPMALVSSDQQIDFYQNEQMLNQMRAFSHRLEDVTRTRDVLCRPLHSHPAMPFLNIEPLLEKPLQALSAGEMRRLLIGRALLHHPRMLILDEPFNGLDRTTRQILFDLLTQLVHSGTQMVLITHRSADIPPAFNHLMHIDHGRVKWTGTVDAFDPVGAGAGAVSPSSKGAPFPPPPAGFTGGTSTGTEILVRMRDVHVRYGRNQVLAGIDWTVRAGEHWALIGPNGAGKSTLLKLITGDNLQGYANTLELFGQPRGAGASIWQIKQHIGYVADDLQLRYQKKMSAFDVVCSGFFDSVGLYRQCSDAQRQTARRWMERTGTGPWSGRPFARLSFGQQRMVLIVRAMVKSPRLLILDEPCNSLDAANRTRLLEMLDTIGRSGATNLLYVSHRFDEMPACITHRLVIDAGRIQKDPGGQI